MTYQEWVDNIPFYPNGTLTAQELQQFEGYLRQNPHYIIELEQWRTLAEAVVHEIYPKGVLLPPLAPRVIEGVQQGRGLPLAPSSTQVSAPATPPMAVRTPRQRGISISVTLAAAVVVMVIFAGVFIASLQNRPPDDFTTGAVVAAYASETANAKLAATPTLDDAGSPAVILSYVPPQIIPTNTLIFSGELDFGVPPTSPPQGGGEANLSTLQEFAPAATEPPLDPTQCYVANETSFAVDVYIRASSSSFVIGQMQPSARYATWVYTGSDVAEPFYQIYLPQGGGLGWVDVRAVRLYGPSGTPLCDQLLLPTPTLAADVMQITASAYAKSCTVASLGGMLTLYDYPKYPNVRLSDIPTEGLEAVDFYVENNFTWYRVIVPGVGFAWVSSMNTILNGDCSALPLNTTPERPTPTPTPS